MTTGIYTITSPSGGQYIGSAVDVQSRWRVHRHLLRRGKHNRAFQRAANKYGAETFEFSILLICSASDLLFYEQRAIDCLRPRYNGRPLAASALGMRHSSETIEKISLVKTGTRLSLEHRTMISEQMRGNSWNRGRKLTEDHKRNISEGIRRVAFRPSAKHMKNLSEINLGKKKSKEEIARRTATRHANAFLIGKSYGG